MHPPAYWVFLAMWVGCLVSWIVGMKYFLAIRAELSRARKAGELPDLPIARRGLPMSVLLTDVLPNVANERRKLVRAFLFFAGFWLAGVAVISIFAPHGFK